MNLQVTRSMYAACFLAAALALPAYAQQTNDPFVGVEQLSKGATTVKNVDLDKDTMRAAAGMDPQAGKSLNGMDDVSVHEYVFPKPGMYALDAVEPYARKLTTGGWKQMVYKQDSGELSVVAMRDVDGGEEKELAVLKAEPTELKFVYVRYRGKLTGMGMDAIPGSDNPQLEHRPN